MVGEPVAGKVVSFVVGIDNFKVSLQGEFRDRTIDQDSLAPTSIMINDGDDVDVGN